MLQAKTQSATIAVAHAFKAVRKAALETRERIVADGVFFA